MVINFSKPPPQLPSIKVDGCPLERFDSVTLLGVILSSDLSWDMHVGHILKKAQSRLFALNMLRRAKVSGEDIMQIFSSKIRPVLEYASPVWHPGLTCEQSDDIEAIQKRACHIAYPTMSYEECLQTFNIPTLKERRHEQCRQLFVKIQTPTDKLNRILPKERDNVRNIRKLNKFPLPKVHTNSYKNSFLPYVLFNCQ